MNREQIEKVGRDYALDQLGIVGLPGRAEAMKAFVAGADWRINYVWHTDVYSGNTRRAILVRFNNGLFNVFEDIRDLKGIEDLVGMFAYLDDLIPERKEETV